MSNIIELPKLKERLNTEKISLAVPEKLKKDLESLKYNKGINVSEWLRRIIIRELETLDKTA